MEKKWPEIFSGFHSSVGLYLLNRERPNIPLLAMQRNGGQKSSAKEPDCESESGEHAWLTGKALPLRGPEAR
jgi:hypothetical protein